MRFIPAFWLLGMMIGLSACEIQHKGADDASQSGEENDWQVLFHHNDTRGWRSTKSDTFPNKGWKLRNGLLTGTGDGGDIISAEQYGNFELEWEWKMLTTGGNSGVKYFVRDYGTNGEKQWLGL